MSSQETPKQQIQSKPTNIGQVRCAGKVPGQANNRANVIRNESSSSEMVENENEDEGGHHRQCRDLTVEELQKRFPEVIN